MGPRAARRRRAWQEAVGLGEGCWGLEIGEEAKGEKGERGERRRRDGNMGLGKKAKAITPSTRGDAR